MRHRKNPSNAIDRSRGGEAGTTKRRGGRGWGPFSGGQLTVIIVTFAVLLLLPVGAWAVSGTTVFVTDSVTGKTAAVNASRQLSVAATGSVTATQTPPSASYTAISVATESTGCNSITPTVPAGKALVVTSITVQITSVSNGPVSVQAVSATPGSPCGALNFADEISISGPGVSQVIPIASGFPVKPGHVVGLTLNSASGPIDAVAVSTVHGYLVSSTLCTVSGPPTGCN